jgi:UPF0042 nucleotide-binding protein
MRFKTGLDKPVEDYVMSSSGAQEFYAKLLDMMQFTLPAYAKE